MLERELKLHVPPDSRRAVTERMLTLGGREQRLRARYFDTADRELARAGIALRLRLEGEQWVQTVKAPGPDEVSRIEINHTRPGPELDLSLYGGTPVAALLADLAQPLTLRYETDILRLAARQAVSTEAGQAEVELAYDVGVVRAGAFELQIHELELESVSGPAQAIFDLGADWIRWHALLLDLRSKAERGDLLARHAGTDTAGWGKPESGTSAMRNAIQHTQDVPPGDGLHIDPCALGLLKPQRAGNINLKHDMTLLQAYLACLADCINHVVRNATLLAGVDTLGASQALQGRYVHQLRVGMRRLRSCWKFFGKWVAAAPSQAATRDFFAQLGSVSDNDVLRFDIAPRLAQAGMPPLPAPAARAVAQSSPHDAREMAASPEFQLCLLSLLAQQMQAADGAASQATRPRRSHKQGKQADRDLGAKLSAKLNRWLRQLCREGRHFRQLPVAQQHDLRKKLKRLRYSLEFSGAMLPGPQLASIRALLTPLQQAMGELNDMYNAWDYYKALSDTEPAALFALGWLKARQDMLQERIQKGLDRLEATGRH